MKKQQTVTTAVSPRQVVAQARLRAASEHIEAAQHELERAVSALVSLNWMQPEQIRVSKLRDRVHAMFYRLSAFSYARAKACAKATLDREVEAGDEDGHRGCCWDSRRRRDVALVCDGCNDHVWTCPDHGAQRGPYCMECRAERTS